MPALAISRECCSKFGMPMPGIYDLRIHHEQILEPVVMRHWKIAEITGLNAEAEKSRERVIAHIEKVQRVAARMARSAEAVTAQSVNA